MGLKLVKTIDLPGGGQHFFFESGLGSHIAFFWFPKAAKGVPGVSLVDPKMLYEQGEFSTAHGSMNHIAFNVSESKLVEYRKRLKAHNVHCSPFVYHTRDEHLFPTGFASKRSDPGVFMSSFYFFGPDGEYVELVSQHSAFDPPTEAVHYPKTAADADSADAADSDSSSSDTSIKLVLQVDITS